MSKENEKYNQRLSKAAVCLSQDPTATLQDIADYMLVGRATLHRQFKNRKQLIIEITHFCLDEIDRKISPIFTSELSNIEKFEAMVLTMIKMGKHYAFLLYSNSFFTDTQSKAHYEAQIKEIYKLVQALKADGYIVPTTSTDWVVAYLDGLFYAAWTMHMQKKKSLQDITDELFFTLSNGLIQKD